MVKYYDKNWCTKKTPLCLINYFYFFNKISNYLAINFKNRLKEKNNYVNKQPVFKDLFISVL